jgi:palmitoyltransferase
MDHHCPWTANCVSHTTFPHFIRFLFYTTIGLSLLQTFLFTRLAHLWNSRDMPAYLGPNMFELGHLFATLVVNTITIFCLGILLIRNIWCLAVNTTTIEGWEIERHKTLIRRARHFGGYLEGADGTQIRIKKQEFPYDVGIWANIVLGMGSANPLSWFNPLAATPDLKAGFAYPTNEFEDADVTWPPPDPDRSYRRRTGNTEDTGAFTYQDSTLSPGDTLEAFRARQAEDQVRKRKPFMQRMEQRLEKEKGGQIQGWLAGNARNGDVDLDEDAFEYGDDASEENEDEQRKYGDGEGEGEEGWRNSEGERLQDFGVDEDVEFYDEQEDEIPLAELLARRQAASVSEQAYS